jgi:hypothetical protein
VGFTGICKPITSSGYDVQGDHSVADWQKCQLGRALKFGSLPVSISFFCPKDILFSRIVGKLQIFSLKEVDA